MTTAYILSAHNGLLLRYNDEERGKTEISKGLARLQKLRDQSIFLLRRFRSADEILNFSPEVLWRRAESYASGPMAEAEAILRQEAIPAQKQGNFSGVLALARKAGALLAAAELAVQAARELEEAERHLLHLEACAKLIPALQKSLPARGASQSAAPNDLTWRRPFSLAG